MRSLTMGVVSTQVRLVAVSLVFICLSSAAVVKRASRNCEEWRAETPCSQLCGGGTQMLVQHCQDGTNYDTVECNTRLCVPDCTLCDYGSSSVYFPDYYDCSRYYRCERIVLSEHGDYDYRRHHSQCAVDTYWNQVALGCGWDPSPDCLLVDRDDPTPSTPPADGSCDFLPVDYDPSLYFWKSGNVQMPCPQGTVYDHSQCSCVQGGDGRPPACAQDDGLLLYFPFNDNFDDVTCAKAHGEKHGDVTIVEDGAAGGSAYFQGSGLVLIHYMENFFSGKEVDTLSISVWFKRTGELRPLQGIVNNGNCYVDPSFSVNVGPGQVASGSVYASEAVSVDDYAVKQWEWEHAVLVYDGQEVRYYLNGTQQESPSSLTGFIQNRQCPMTIGQQGQDQSQGFFTGYIDELRIYTRILVPTEVQLLFVDPAGGWTGGGATAVRVQPGIMAALLLVVTMVIWNTVRD